MSLAESFKEIHTYSCPLAEWNHILGEKQILSRIEKVTGAPCIPAKHPNATVLLWKQYKIVFHWEKIGEEVADMHLAIPKSSLKACRLLPMLAAVQVFKSMPEVKVLIIEPMRGKMTNLAIKLGWKKVPSPRLNMFYLNREDFGELL